MSTKQNLTVSLDRDTIRKAKILASRRGTSVSGLVASQLQETVEEDDRYEAARRAEAREVIKTYAVWQTEVIGPPEIAWPRNWRSSND